MSALIFGNRELVKLRKISRQAAIEIELVYATFVLNFYSDMFKED